MPHLRFSFALLLCAVLLIASPSASAFPEPARKDFISVCTGLLRNGWNGVRRLFWKTQRDKLKALLHEQDDHVDHLREVLLLAFEKGAEQENLAIGIFRESGARLLQFVEGEGDARVDQALKAIAAKQDLDYFGRFLRGSLAALQAGAWPPDSPEARRMGRIEEAFADYGELVSLDLFGDSPH